MRGFGAKIAKNIILSNPFQISIFDDKICKINDLGSNFFLTNQDILNKKRRDEASLKKLLVNKIKNFDVVIITEITKSEIVNKINKECHENNKCFIYTFSLGLFGFIFCDFGQKLLMFQIVQFKCY